MEWNPYDRTTPTNPYPTYQWMCHHASVYNHGTVGLYALIPSDDVMRGHLNAAPLRRWQHGGPPNPDRRSILGMPTDS